MGGVRFNLSKSGIGASVGVKGLRLGSGPRGNYVHMGRNGVYYRAALSSRKNAKKATPRNSDCGDTAAANIYNQTEIDSADVSYISDALSEDLLDEINKKNHRSYLWPLSFLLILVPSYGLPLTVLFSLLIYYLIDVPRKTTAIIYDLDEETEGEIQQFYDAFETIKQCRGIWHVSSVSSTSDTKRNAGANTLVSRSPIIINSSTPKGIKTNVKIPSIPVGRQTLYFFPDRVLIYDGKRAGGIGYDGLRITSLDKRFIENDAVPSDSTVIGSTWRYTNKSGGPDMRYKDNRRIPILLYCEVDFNSDSGINERIQLSRPSAANGLIEQFEVYKNSIFLTTNNAASKSLLGESNLESSPPYTS